jgi:hypothetical protein
MMRIVLFVAFILLAAVGGVMIYRAVFLDPSTAVVVTETHVRELPSISRIVLGAILLLIGAGAAFFSIKKRA